MDPQNISAQRLQTSSAGTGRDGPTAAVDVDAYIAGVQAENAAGQCFICELAEEQTVREGESVAYRDEHWVVFFPPQPRLYGYCLLASLRDATDAVSDFTEDDYLALQLRVHRLGRVLAEITPTECLNVFSFGSMQGVAHVHWHLAPLPPRIPFREQRLAAVGKLAYLGIAEAERDAPAARVGAGMVALAEQDRHRPSGPNTGATASRNTEGPAHP
ncbi:HIT family protein [Nocardia takedensis]|uniref:HIT family protein n=1 Tax=Nocardia takedensis TaxID=259390 RepID=UPI003F777239